MFCDFFLLCVTVKCYVVLLYFILIFINTVLSFLGYIHFPELCIVLSSVGFCHHGMARPFGLQMGE